MPLPVLMGYAFHSFMVDGDAEPMGFGYHFNNGSGETDPAEVGLLLAGAWGGNFDAGDLADGWTYMGLETKLGTPSGDSVAFTTVAEDGTFAVECLPVNCAFLIRKRTSHGGRHGVGRMYFPSGLCIGEGDVTPAGMIDSGSITAINTKLEAWRADLATALVPMIVKDDTDDDHVVTSLVIDSKIATQRRRLR